VCSLSIGQLIEKVLKNVTPKKMRVFMVIINEGFIFVNSVLNKLSLFVSTEAIPTFFNFTDGQYEFREKFIQHPSDIESHLKISTDVKASLPWCFRT
jgi:hypothetical protein